MSSCPNCNTSGNMKECKNCGGVYCAKCYTNKKGEFSYLKSTPAANKCPYCGAFNAAKSV